MQTFLKLDPKIEKVVPFLRKIRSRQKGFHNKARTITCSYRIMQEKKTNFYEVLSLQSKNVGFDEIRKAYRSMALQFHPDVCRLSAKEESTKRFVELQKAYETLSDPVSRRLYDYELNLVASIGLGLEIRMEERKNSFPKEVWEMQLYGLSQRSHIRLQRKNKKYM
ncbi:chaperone protein dnaJ 20, chloroplastic-like [Ricinus communis]|uniref:Chaperone protein DNAj, putative n=1 Tax=Ricinus communis TaxID=3988 RepID=B9SSK0_RICCO|nr:chaperone protein dnaJ 20, chloroplastic-like [Ricinus communis]EEF33388.1 chaperone protein DNAj, putative [Ricinus communis]|eukprot:XP_025014863.1 chaperone protein dnaJ 20, chloroplastic-like [Ricinus communis]